ncbi:MAG: type I-C CRISPR-associated protein Cas8c/Csd1 [Ignavibacteriales bacterium]
MIINALNKYYEILAEDEKSEIPLYGYSVAKVGFALNISKDGELLDVISLKDEINNGKKLVPRLMIVPEQIKRSGTKAPPNFLCDNNKYVLGIDKDSKVCKKEFESFKELHNNVLNKAQGKAAKAIISFINKWDANKITENPSLKEYLAEILEGNNLIFRLDGEKGYIHNDLEVKTLWEKYKTKEDDNIMGQCLITGDIAKIERIHNSLKGLYSKQLAPNGWTLVAVDKGSTAFESYGKTQSYNSPISKKIAFSYTTVLNHMLSNQKQKIQIGDATTVFWAESPNDIYPNLAMQLLNPKALQEDDKIVRDIKTEKTIEGVLKSAKEGKGIPSNIHAEVNPLTKFYILGLSPNASRISVRFFHGDTFGNFVEKTVQHYKDMEIIKDFENRPDNIPIWQILRETVSPKSSDKEAQPLLAGAIMRAILSAGIYPQSLYTSIVRRVKTDCDESVNFYVRASIIKAYLLRKARITSNQKMKEVLTVALNEETTDIAYLLGRLFAILEKTQKDAGNETIRARYFSSAMSTPKAVFPILLRLAQHHILKAEYGHINDKRIESVMNNIEQFPSHLSLDQQGLFTLGYYQQKPKLWEKQVKEKLKGENENE